MKYRQQIKGELRSGATTEQAEKVIKNILNQMLNRMAQQNA